jgi:DNA-binding NarL/FixJ family response regulator
VLLGAIEMLVAAGRGDVSALGRLPAARERWRRDGLIGVLTGAAAIDLYGRRDGAAAAVAAYDEVCEVLGSLWDPAFQARVRLAALVLGALVDGAGEVPAAGRDGVRAIGDRLVADADLVVHTLAERSRPFGVEGQAWLARVRASRLHLDWVCGVAVDPDELVAAWQASVAGFEAFGEGYEAARGRLRLAVALRAAGRVDQSQREAALARAVAERLGAAPLLAALAELDQGGSRGATASGELTPREREILALVAVGRTNGEVAKQLFISTKTVSVHVSNILAKLGASGRTEAAAIAHRDGLV